MAKKIPKMMKLPITVDFYLNTKDIIEYARKQNVEDRKFKWKKKWTDEWLTENWEKIIETISFLFNEWDGWAVNKIEKRSQLWFDRSERKSWAKDKTFFELNRGYFFTAVNSVHLTLKEKEGWTKPKNMSKETRKELEAERLKDKV